MHRGIAQFMGPELLGGRRRGVDAGQGTVKVHRMVLALNYSGRADPGPGPDRRPGRGLGGLRPERGLLRWYSAIQNGRMTELILKAYKILQLAEMPKVER